MTLESKLDDLFDQIDIDGGGSISTDELFSIVLAVGHLDKPKIMQIVNACDADGSGEIERDEFPTVITLLAGERNVDEFIGILSESLRRQREKNKANRSLFEAPKEDEITLQRRTVRKEPVKAGLVFDEVPQVFQDFYEGSSDASERRRGRDGSPEYFYPPSYPHSPDRNRRSEVGIQLSRNGDRIRRLGGHRSNRVPVKRVLIPPTERDPHGDALRVVGGGVGLAAFLRSSKDSSAQSPSRQRSRSRGRDQRSPRSSAPPTTAASARLLSPSNFHGAPLPAESLRTAAHATRPRGFVATNAPPRGRRHHTPGSVAHAAPSAVAAAAAVWDAFAPRSAELVGPALANVPFVHPSRPTRPGGYNDVNIVREPPYHPRSPRADDGRGSLLSQTFGGMPGAGLSGDPHDRLWATRGDPHAAGAPDTFAPRGSRPHHDLLPHGAASADPYDFSLDGGRARHAPHGGAPIPSTPTRHLHDHSPAAASRPHRTHPPTADPSTAQRRTASAAGPRRGATYVPPRPMYHPDHSPTRSGPPRWSTTDSAGTAPDADSRRADRATRAQRSTSASAGGRPPLSAARAARIRGPHGAGDLLNASASSLPGPLGGHRRGRWGSPSGRGSERTSPAHPLYDDFGHPPDAFCSDNGYCDAASPRAAVSRLGDASPYVSPHPLPHDRCIAGERPCEDRLRALVPTTFGPEHASGGGRKDLFALLDKDASRMRTANARMLRQLVVPEPSDDTPSPSPPETKTKPIVHPNRPRYHKSAVTLRELFELHTPSRRVGAHPTRALDSSEPLMQSAAFRRFMVEARVFNHALSIYNLDSIYRRAVRPGLTGLRYEDFEVALCRAAETKYKADIPADAYLLFMRDMAEGLHVDIG